VSGRTPTAPRSGDARRLGWPWLLCGVLLVAAVGVVWRRSRPPEAYLTTGRTVEEVPTSESGAGSIPGPGPVAVSPPAASEEPNGTGSGVGSGYRLLVLSEVGGDEPGPLEGAEVHASMQREGRAGPVLVTGRELGEGSYEIRKHGGGVLTGVKVKAPGHVGAVIDPQEFATGKVPVVRLRRLASVHVSVATPDGAPCSGASVRVTHLGDTEAFEAAVRDLHRPYQRIPLVERREVDAGGGVEFGPLVPGHELLLECMDVRYGRVERRVAALQPGESRRIVLRLDRGGAARVRFLDRYGKAVVGGLVTAYHKQGSMNRGVAKAATDAHGVAVLFGLPEGLHRFEATGWDASGSEVHCASTDEPVELVAGEVRELDTLVADGGSLEVLFTVDGEARGEYLVNTSFSCERAFGSHSFQSPVGRRFRIWSDRFGAHKLHGTIHLPEAEIGPNIMAGHTISDWGTALWGGELHERFEFDFARPEPPQPVEPYRMALLREGWFPPGIDAERWPEVALNSFSLVFVNGALSDGQFWGLQELGRDWTEVSRSLRNPQNLIILGCEVPEPPSGRLVLQMGDRWCDVVFAAGSVDAVDLDAQQWLPSTRCRIRLSDSEGAPVQGQVSLYAGEVDPRSQSSGGLPIRLREPGVLELAWPQGLPLWLGQGRRARDPFVRLPQIDGQVFEHEVRFPPLPPPGGR
jgi:hypothetical protein